MSTIHQMQLYRIIFDYIYSCCCCYIIWLWAEFDEIDTQRSFFVESGRCATRYLRILRISFVKPFDGREVIVERPLLINYATFEPLMLSSGGIFGIPLFENLSQTMKRAMVWLQTSNPGKSSLIGFLSVQQTYYSAFCNK